MLKVLNLADTCFPSIKGADKCCLSYPKHMVMNYRKSSKILRLEASYKPPDDLPRSHFLGRVIVSTGR